MGSPGSDRPSSGIVTMARGRVGVKLFFCKREGGAAANRAPDARRRKPVALLRGPRRARTAWTRAGSPAAGRRADPAAAGSPPQSRRPPSCRPPYGLCSAGRASLPRTASPLCAPIWGRRRRAPRSPRTQLDVGATGHKEELSTRAATCSRHLHQIILSKGS